MFNSLFDVDAKLVVLCIVHGNETKKKWQGLRRWELPMAFSNGLVSDRPKRKSSYQNQTFGRASGVTNFKRRGKKEMAGPTA